MTHSAETEAIFCLGSNFGNREDQVSSSLKWLSTILSDFKYSKIYATPDCYGGPRKYLNAVAIGKTQKLPAELEMLCKEHELECGRNEDARAKGNVPIDIDLVAYGGKILRKKDYESEFFLKGYKEMSVL